VEKWRSKVSPLAQSRHHGISDIRDIHVNDTPKMSAERQYRRYHGISCNFQMDQNVQSCSFSGIFEVGAAFESWAQRLNLELRCEASIFYSSCFTETRCQQLQFKPRKFHKGSGLSGWVPRHDERVLSYWFYVNYIELRWAKLPHFQFQAFWFNVGLFVLFVNLESLWCLYVIAAKEETLICACKCPANKQHHSNSL
jgi:hypothetical protein